MNTLSIHRPPPSIEMRTPAADSTPDEGGTGKLTALVGVDDLWSAKARECFFKRCDGECAVHGVGQPPRQHRNGSQSMIATR